MHPVLKSIFIFRTLTPNAHTKYISGLQDRTEKFPDPLLALRADRRVIAPTRWPGRAAAA